jgi:hypothetical protein
MELSDVQRMLEQLQKATDPSEKKKLSEQAQQRLKSLSDFAARSAGSKPLEESLRRALEQLSLAQDKKLKKEALEAAKESLDLAGLDLKDMAQALRDLEALEEGLKAAQLARLLNELQGLDGEGCAGCQSLGDYEAYYKRLMSQLQADGEGSGPGMGPTRASGEGGEAPEDPDQKTDFKSERSRSALQAGKILLQWKTREVSDAGAVRERYRSQLEAVKQGVSEAILQERVPPGYHEAIRKYFDTLGDERERE